MSRDCKRKICRGICRGKIWGGGKTRSETKQKGGIKRETREMKQTKERREEDGDFEMERGRKRKEKEGKREKEEALKNK